MALRVPAALVSLGAFTFVADRSKLLPGFKLSAPSTHSAVAGQQFKVDRAGHSIVPMDYTVAFEYMISPTGTLHYVQTHFDALIAALMVAPVQLLTCFAVGQSSDTITGMARFEDLTEVDGQPNHRRLQIQWFVEGGMS